METKTQSNEVHPSSPQEREVLTALKEARDAFADIDRVLVMAAERGADRFSISDMRLALKQFVPRISAAIAKAESTPSVGQQESELIERAQNWDAYDDPLNTRNLVDDLIRALLASSVAAAPAWRAMESAPKDGTRVICWGPQLAVAECEYRQEWHGQPEGWYRSNQHPRVEPTHWMPLPRSPRAGEDQQP